MKTKILILMVALLLAVPAFSQVLVDEYPRAQQLFAQAQRLMRERDYLGAIDAYSELVDGFKNSQYRDIYNYALARAYYLLGDYDRSEALLITYPTLFPNSYLLPYSYHLRANCAYRSGKLEEAFSFYNTAYHRAEDDRLRGLAGRSILAEVEAGYVPPDSAIRQLPADLKCPVKTRIAYLMTGTWSKEQVDSLLGDCPREAINRIEKPKTSSVKITAGMMLPLSGPYAKYGQSILDGALLAGDVLSSRGAPLEVITYDTRADHVIGARVAMALADANVDLAVGPLLSNIAATVAAAMADRETPLLVPAATQAGFTELSQQCFQMSPNMLTVGRGLAQYAVKHRNMNTLAVIAPTTVDEMTMADEFVAEARRLGANVVAVEKFRPGETDFGPYIIDIKSALLGPPDDSTFYVTLDGDTLRPGEMPIAIDGMFIPASEQDLFSLLPQLQFYRVKTSFLGADEWNTDKVLQLGEKVLGDAVFYSSRAAMLNSLGFDKFAAAYDGKYGEPPDRLAALGFDAVNLLHDAWRDNRRGPAEIAAFLKTLDGYEGVSGRITFGRARSNIELPLFTLRDGKVRPLVERPLLPETVEEPASSDTTSVKQAKYEW